MKHAHEVRRRKNAVGKYAVGKSFADSGAAVGEGRRVLTVYPLFL